jgi:hypothetical protein
MMLRLALVVLLFPGPCAGQGTFATRSTPIVPDASDAFFKSNRIPRLKIEIAAEELTKLRQKDREYVRCTIIEDDKKRYVDVGIHLKGAAGSFRGLDDRPALTLNFDKFKKGQRFHDLDKLHLNNSVQDATYLQEQLCSELFLANGIATPRAGHARVWLNGRDLGFYVLKEGFDVAFLRRYFDDPSGNLYDGGFVTDLNAALKKQSGSNPDDRSDLQALVKACSEPDLAKRWERVAQLVDIDHFVTFMALELVMCHWDGYCMNRNNYRVYIDPRSKRAYFLPHGMDQMFGDPGYGVLQVPGALVAGVVMTNPDWRVKYRERLNQLLPQFHPPEKLQRRVDELYKRIEPVLAEMNKETVQHVRHHANWLKEQIKARGANLVQQNAIVDPRPLQFNAAGVAAISTWEKRSEADDAKLEIIEKTGEPKLLSITCGAGRCVASWRSRVILPAGKYRFEAEAKGEKIEGNQDSQGTGAGVRLSGNNRTNKLIGTKAWSTLRHEFTIDQPQQEVELVAELRAVKGRVWFKAESLRVVRVGK